MSGPRKSNASQRNVNTWWYMKHGNKEGRKRKKPEASDKDKLNSTENVIIEEAEKEQEVRKSMLGVAAGDEGKDSRTEGKMSKQARKRKLKREAAKQEKLEKKKKKLQSKGEGTFEKDEQVRTNGEQNQKKKRFKKKQRRWKNDSKGVNKSPDAMVASGEISSAVNDTSTRGNTAVSKMQSKPPGESENESQKSKKRSVQTVDDAKLRSGDMNSRSDTYEVDKNWKTLMKRINYKPKKNLEEGSKKFEFGKAEEGLKGHQKIWFDDVDPELLEDGDLIPNNETRKEGNPLLVKGETPTTRLTKYIGIDCEMVGIGSNGEDHMLARVSLVNQHGACIYDKFVAPSEAVTDYRTSVSGITPEKLKNAEEFATVQQEVYDIIKNRILVGHAVQNDLKVLFLSHQKTKIRDTSTYKPFQEICKTKRPSLKLLSRMILDVAVQRSSHDSVEDAQAAMKLFMLHRQAWEKQMNKSQKIQTKKKGKPVTR